MYLIKWQPPNWRTFYFKSCSLVYTPLPTLLSLHKPLQINPGIVMKWRRVREGRTWMFYILSGLTVGWALILKLAFQIRHKKNLAWTCSVAFVCCLLVFPVSQLHSPHLSSYVTYCRVGYLMYFPNLVCILVDIYTNSNFFLQYSGVFCLLHPPFFMRFILWCVNFYFTYM